jgi:hypothetical protein
MLEGTETIVRDDGNIVYSKFTQCKVEMVWLQCTMYRVHSVYPCYIERTYPFAQPV